MNNERWRAPLVQTIVASATSENPCLIVVAKPDINDFGTISGRYVFNPISEKAGPNEHFY